MTEIVTDRSRVLAYKRCKRQRFFEYHALGTGLRLRKLNLPTSIGTLIHRGRALLLEGLPLEKAIETTLKEFDESFHSKEIDLELSEDQLFVYEEQKAFVEAAIRVWYHIQYPKVNGEYEVVEVMGNKAIEPEIEWHLTSPKLGEDHITFMSRPDSILRDRSTGAIVVDSFKTTSYNNIVVYNEEGEQVDKNKYDDQGISELIAVERLLGEEVEGIRMEFFVKGVRKKSAYTLPDGTKEKRKLQQSFLVHPWKKDLGIGGYEYACQWQWNDETGAVKKLGKGWNRVDIWKEMTIKEWVDILLKDNYGELENLFVVPMNYNRSLEDIENWIDQTEYQERRAAKHIEALKSLEPTLCGPRESETGKTYKKWLNQFFDQNREHCYQWGGWCPFVGICWEGEKTTSSIYEKREPHHSKELELFQISKG